MKIFLILFITILLFSNECIKCHKEKSIKCKENIHFTLNKEISLTLKSWGVKDYNKTLENLEDIDKNKIIKEPKDLAIDFLRRKCLRCHLTSKEINPSNNLCLACHKRHKNRLDSFEARTTQSKCLKCHNANFIGTDYLGLFPKDFDESYNAPLSKKGFFPKREYRTSYHHLIEDIHYKKGLSCINCHKAKNGFKVSCLDCHKPSKKHHFSFHSKISCIACHSSWQVNSYKSIILRSDIKNYKEFSRLIKSEDLYLENFLKKALINPSIKPIMPDFINNKKYPGLWYLGYEFRRWNNFFLINYKGKIELARPLLDFELTYINDKNKTIIDAKNFGGFVVTKPHTITKEAKSCEMCHLNDLNLNNKKIIKYNTLKNRLIEGTFLTKEQIDRLKSKYYKIFRAKELFKGE